MLPRTAIATLFAWLLLCTLPASTQVRRLGVPARPHEPPCWQVAGISKAAMQERQALARETRAQVEQVCAGSSLTPQQKHQQIREIQQAAKAKSEALVTPQQQEALQACQKERSAGRPSRMGAPHGVGGGPCAEMSAGPKPPNPGAPAGHQSEPAEEETSPQ